MTPFSLPHPIPHQWIFGEEKSLCDDDDDAFVPPCLLLSTSFLVSLSRSVCDAISTPEIIAVVTNAAAGGGVGVCVIVCGVHSDSAAFRSKSGAADLQAGGAT